MTTKRPTRTAPRPDPADPATADLIATACADLIAAAGELRGALAPIAEQLRTIADPVERIHAAAAVMERWAAVMDAQAVLGEVSREAGRELRVQRGMSYGQIATTLGVSRTRAVQLSGVGGAGKE